MSRNLARRAASVVVAAALLGGALALGGGTASAEDVPLLRDLNTATGSGLISGVDLIDAWIDNGLIDTGSQKITCTAHTYDCPI
ncbi:hypothetical protein ACWFRB_04830 [Rhodococcus sp. NPDC055112]